MSENRTELMMYQTEDGQTKIDVRMENETVWLSLDQMAELFQRDKSTISRHIRNIFAEGELDREAVVAKFATTASDGKTYQVDFYNLDVIISVGYRVRSLRGTQFRIWANSVLKEYLIKGFAMNDDRLKDTGGKDYFDELLERVRDIRSSEKVFWRKVLDIYATSADYSANARESTLFFQTVQNKMLYAATGMTAAELIANRADALKPLMGMTVVKGSRPTLAEAKTAKNYLYEDELKTLNRLVSAYSCHLHFSNSDRNYVKNALDRLVELNLLHFNPQEVQHIKDVIDLRNRVHIRLTNGNELSNADFNRDIYNDAVNLLKTVDEQIYQYAVPLYGCGHTIPISREP